MALANNLIGYGQDESNRLNRAYPSWMTGLDARGIGVANPFTAPSVPFTDIPRGGQGQGFNQQPAFEPVRYNDGYGGRSPSPEGGAPSDAGNGMGNTGDGSFSGLAGDASGLYDAVQSGLGSAGIGGKGMQVGGTIGSMFGPLGTLAGAGLGYAYDRFAGDGNGDGGAPAGGQVQGGPAGEVPGVDTMGGIGGTYGNGGFYHGGIVTNNRLSGPDPSGPDDGYAALDVGEGVLTAKAVKHYGKGLVNKLNRLAVSKEALR